MSRRKRNSARPQTNNPIEWLQHRTGYPTPAEREQIIRLREKISEDVMLLRFEKVPTDDRRYRAVIDKYGQAEVQRAERKFKEGLDTASRVADDAKSYREYRLRYSKFGGEQKFYSAQEVSDLYDLFFEQVQQAMDNNRRTSTEAQDELEKLLLMGWRDWDDITPPAIPPRPADYNIPQPASYPAPINELLEWGDDLHKALQVANEAELLNWKKFIPALTRMALDPGLLNGWSSEKASWAPWHAAHALSVLQAWESAPALAELADLENDWLSDHLPHIWADMGREAEPSLWMILETQAASAKRRALAAEALFMTAETSRAMYNKVVRGFEKILMNTSNSDATLNGYLVMFLKDMQVSEATLNNIYQAFRENRIDEDIITPDQIEEQA
ncbi:MAG: hypothetical protein ABI904_05215 [Chloroflexota bacterium]